MGFGKRLKEVRVDKGISRDELANKIGVSRSAISNYENEISHPKEQIMYDIMKVLNIDANYLFQDEMKESNPPTREQILIEKYNQADGSIKVAVDKLLDMPE